MTFGQTVEFQRHTKALDGTTNARNDAAVQNVCDFGARPGSGSLYLVHCWGGQRWT